MISLSGDPRVLDLADDTRAVGGRGETGTFQRLVSSGSSSSDSWYSASNSLIVFREGCQDPRLLGGPAGLLDGPDLTLKPVAMKDADAGCFGDGDEDLVRGWQPGMAIGRVAVDGAVKPLLNPPSFAPPLPVGPELLPFVLLSAYCTWPWRLGYVGLL